MDLEKLLSKMHEQNASDLHLSAGQPPILRVHGELQPLEGQAVFEQTTLKQMLMSLMNEKQQALFQQTQDIDFAHALSENNRFRVNVFAQHRGISASFRAIPNEIPTFKNLKLPSIFESLCNYPNGIVLVTGPTGSGKSTTLAAMVDHINANSKKHIVTIEDPIEFVHNCKQCLINQREVERHTQSFSAALRAALREDPDIILVGELRDQETIRLALTAAETGHLVFATLHTNSAPKTIDRLIDVFPANEKDVIRSMLSESLRAVVTQKLFKTKQESRVAAHEIMVCTPAIRNMIRENKIPQIYSALQTGQAQGMCTLEQSLEKLSAAGLIGTNV